MDHCLTQVLCAGPPLRMAQRDFVGGSVILQNQWMVHGDICRTLFKVTYRIAAAGHHIAHQLVDFRYRAGWVVNEPRLNPAPGFCEAETIVWREWSDMETLDSFLALFETGFRKPLVPAFLQGAGIFRAKPSTQSFSPALFENDQRGDTDNHNPDVEHRLKSTLCS